MLVLSLLLPLPACSLQLIFRAIRPNPNPSNILNAYYSTPSLHTTKHLVVRLDQIISQLLDSHSRVSSNDVLSVVCDEDGEVGLDDNDALSSLVRLLVGGKVKKGVVGRIVPCDRKYSFPQL